MDLSMQSGQKEVPGSRGSGGGGTVGGEIVPIDLPPQSDLGVSCDSEPSDGVWRMPFESLPDL